MVNLTEFGLKRYFTEEEMLALCQKSMCNFIVLNDSWFAEAEAEDPMMYLSLGYNIAKALKPLNNR